MTKMQKEHLKLPEELLRELGGKPQDVETLSKNLHLKAPIKLASPEDMRLGYQRMAEINLDLAELWTHCESGCLESYERDLEQEGDFSAYKTR